MLIFMHFGGYGTCMSICSKFVCGWHRWTWGSGHVRWLLVAGAVDLPRGLSGFNRLAQPELLHAVVSPRFETACWGSFQKARKARTCKVPTDQSTASSLSLGVLFTFNFPLPFNNPLLPFNISNSQTSDNAPSTPVASWEIFLSRPIRLIKYHIRLNGRNVCSQRR